MEPIPSNLWPDPEALSARIRSERERLGLTQREIAEKLGVSQVTYHRFESGANLPQLGTVFKLADAGMDPLTLLPELFGALKAARKVASKKTRK